MRQPIESDPIGSQQAITSSLMRLFGGTVEGIGHYACELAYCENISRATVAWMIAAGTVAAPPQYKRGRGPGRR